MRMPRYTAGVPSEYTVHVHPWPTRYHGPIYTRPEFGLPYVQSPYAVFKPDDFSSYYAEAGIGQDAPAPVVPEQYSTLKVFAGVAVGLAAAVVVLRYL